MKTPETTEFLKEVEAGHCRLIPNTADEMKYMMDSCMYNKLNISKQVTTFLYIIDLWRSRSIFRNSRREGGVVLMLVPNFLRALEFYIERDNPPK